MTLVAQMTVDGRITRAPGASSYDLIDRLGQDALIDVHRYRAQCDGIAVGRWTVLIDNPSLTTRHVEGSDPVRVIFGGSAEFRGDEKVLTDGKVTVLVVDPDQAHRKFDKNVAVVTGYRSPKGLREICERLRAEFAISHLMLEGGATLTSSFFEARLVDELVIYTVPCLSESGEALSLLHPAKGQFDIALRSCVQIGGAAKCIYGVNWT